MARKTKAEDIDASFIINAFRKNDMNIPPQARALGETEENPPEEEAEGNARDMSQEDTEEKPPLRKRRTRSKEEEYLAIFFKDVRIPARIGKTVYIRKEFHERIQRIVRIIGKDEISLFSYIDNVLSHHFEDYEEAIKKTYDTNSSIF